MTRRRGTIGSVATVLAVSAALAMPAAPGLARFRAPRFWPAVRSSSGWTVVIAPGVSYSRFHVVTAGGPLAIHHLVLDLNNPGVRLDVALAHDRLISGDETVSSMVRRSGAVAGINADFFDIGESGMPLNILVQHGRLLRSPSGRVALAIRPGGGLEIAHYRWHGSVVNLTTHISYWLAGYNTGFVPDGIVAVSNVRGYGAPAPEAGATQTVVRLAPAPDVTQDAAASLTASLVPFPRGEERYIVKSVRPQQAYYAPFPRDSILLVGRGAAGAWLRNTMSAGAAVLLDLKTTPDWRAARAIVGGGPLLVAGGRLVDDPSAPVPQERNHRNPVAAIGISQDGRRVILAVIDGRQPGLSVGLTRPQLAAYLQWLGAYQAMEFDSGGSATMVARVPWRRLPCVVNSPSDGHERPVGNALLVRSGP